MIRKKHQGVALITVLLVFALVTVLATQVVERNFMDIARTTSRIDSQQSYYYALAGEEYARQLLARDFMEQQIKADSLTDNWAQLKQSFDIDNGQLEITITDMQGRFNLNNLMTDKGGVDQSALLAFEKILKALRQEPVLAKQLLDKLKSEKPLLNISGSNKKVSDNRLIDISELYLLPAMNQNQFRQLTQLVVVLPERTSININTLSADLVKALAQDVSAVELQQFQRKQKEGGYTSVNDWFSDPIAGKLDQLPFGVQSGYFEALIKADYAGRQYKLRSLIYRDLESGKLSIVNRHSYL